MTGAIKSALAALGFSLALTSLTWNQQDRVRQAWWDYRSERPLSVSEMARVDRCEPIHWDLGLRVLTQGQGRRCGLEWFARSLSPLVTNSWRRGRLVVFATVGDRTQRLRATGALLLLGEAPPLELGFWLNSGEMSPTDRRWFIKEALSRYPEGEWVHPRLAFEQDVETFLTDGSAVALHLLRVVTEWPTVPGELWSRGAAEVLLDEMALERADLTANGLTRVGGLNKIGVPEWVRGTFWSRSRPCEWGISCEDFLLDLYSQWLDEEGRPNGAEEGHFSEDYPALYAHVRVLYQGDGLKVRAFYLELKRTERWLVACTDPAFALVLMAQDDEKSATASKKKADPMTLLREGRSSTWTTLLVVRSLARRLGLVPRIEQLSRSVRFSVGGRSLERGVESGLSAEAPFELNDAQLDALAAAEVAAADQSRWRRALRLALYAARIDPLGRSLVKELRAEHPPLSGMPTLWERDVDASSVKTLAYFH